MLLVHAAAGHTARADTIPFDQASAYLEEITTLEASFTQTVDGIPEQGKLYLHRPGRLRLEYGSEGALVIAANGALLVFDPRSNRNPSRYSVNSTPLGILLDDDVDLRSGILVASRSQTEDGITVLRAQDPNNPQHGHIELWFSDNPIGLRGWSIVDRTGTEIQMALTDIKLGHELPRRIFNLRDAAEQYATK